MENLNSARGQGEEGGYMCLLKNLIFLTCCPHVVVPSQVYALVGSEQKGQVLGGMVAAGAGKMIKSNQTYPSCFSTVIL